jgi:16S rRNA (adenine1518-N6/adenine1519-N6)-dimethyltransferase
LRARRSLSQNFLVDPNLQQKVADALEAGRDDTVLEVGPGHGELTRHLVGRVARLVLVEKDDRLAEELEARWGERDEIRIVRGDALEIDLADLVEPPYRVLSNVPYGITSPLLFRFLALTPPPARIVVTVQREVGHRIVAAPGTRDYGSLSVGVQVRARARIAFGVSRQAFRPVPDVESVTVVLDPDPERIRALPARELRRLTRAAFGWRRKQIQKILRSAPGLGLGREGARALCESLGLDPRVRPAEIPPDLYVAMARLLRRTEAAEGHGEGR